MKFGFFKKICICILPLAMLLSGCCGILGQKNSAPYRIVHCVRIVYRHESLESSREFYREENIRQILDYLRYIDPYGIPREDPETVFGRIFLITLIYTDGSERVYEQRADQYLRVDSGQWKRIDPQKALYLSGLLSMMTGDAPATDPGPIPPLVRPHL